MESTFVSVKVGSNVDERFRVRVWNVRVWVRAAVLDLDAVVVRVAVSSAVGFSVRERVALRDDERVPSAVAERRVWLSVNVRDDVMFSDSLSVLTLPVKE